MTTTTRAPRKKKGAAKAAEASDEAPADPVATTNTDTNMMECLPPAPVVEKPPFEPTGTYTPTPNDGDRGAANDATTEPRLRTWVVDEARGYCRMSDEDYHRLVIQLNVRPPEDVLTAVKGAGFRFQSDYRGQKNAWVRRKDFEGRLQVEAIDKLVHEMIPVPSSPTR